MTPSQAVALIDDEVVPETELFSDDDVTICQTFDDDTISDAFNVDKAEDLEATQPPILTPINLEDPRRVFSAKGHNVLIVRCLFKTVSLSMLCDFRFLHIAEVRRSADDDVANITGCKPSLCC